MERVVPKTAAVSTAAVRVVVLGVVPDGTTGRLPACKMPAVPGTTRPTVAPGIGEALEGTETAFRFRPSYAN